MTTPLTHLRASLLHAHTVASDLDRAARAANSECCTLMAKATAVGKGNCAKTEVIANLTGSRCLDLITKAAAIKAEIETLCHDHGIALPK